jgi:hypothetical protein
MIRILELEGPVFSKLENFNLYSLTDIIMKFYRKHLLNSPLLSRRQRKSKTTESSDDEVVQSGDEVFNGKNYRDLESFQKAQLRQKVF